MPPKVYLLSRTLDPILGVFTGLLAYQLHETNPRSAPPPGHTLRELLSWQWGETQKRKGQRELDEERRGGEEWERVRKEMDIGEGAK
jgi:hypothetical protein